MSCDAGLLRRPADQLLSDCMATAALRQHAVPPCRHERRHRVMRLPALRLTCQPGSRFREMTIPDTIWTWLQNQEQGDEHGNKMQQSDVLV